MTWLYYDRASNGTIRGMGFSCNTETAYRLKYGTRVRCFGVNRFCSTVVLGVIFVLSQNSEAYPTIAQAETHVTEAAIAASQPVPLAMLVLDQQMGETATERQADSVKLRDPNHAIFMALVPGSVVHGAGHFYAGRPATGLILFGGELAGAGLFYLGAVTAIGDGKYSPGGAVAVATGATLFFGSWAYDLVFAPLSISRRNEELLREKRADFKLQIKDKEIRIVSTWRF
jgi:TM2 domain-containing membrane protein YozV